MTMMRKVGAVAGALLMTATVLAAPAHAAEKAHPTDLKQRLEEKVREGKLTKGEAEVVQKLHDLRRSYHQKFRADAHAVIDQAVKDGKITADQAERFKAPPKRRMPNGGPVMKEKREQTNQETEERK